MDNPADLINVAIEMSLEDRYDAIEKLSHSCIEAWCARQQIAPQEVVRDSPKPLLGKSIPSRVRQFLQVEKGFSRI